MKKELMRLTVKIVDLWPLKLRWRWEKLVSREAEMWLAERGEG
jgi:hypothetical protein